MTASRQTFIFVQPHMRAGGSEMQTALLANELARRGARSVLMLHSEEGEMLSVLSPDVEVIGLGGASHSMLPLIAARLYRALQRFNDGLVIVKLWSSLLAVQPSVTALSRLRFVMCEDLDPRLHADHLRFGRTKQLLMRPIFRYRRQVTANTAAVADAMVETYRLPRRPTVMYGGMDFERIRQLATPTAARRGGDALVIVTVASLRPRKGHLRALEALARIDTPWFWNVVGAGPLEDELKAAVVRAELTDRVQFHGALENPYPVLASGDLLLHLPYSEAFGLVILEAAALGVPVVSSRAIGPLEIASAGDSGGRWIHFVDADSPIEVAEAVTQVATAPHHKSHLPTLEGAFAVEAAADRWLALARSEGV